MKREPTDRVSRILEVDHRELDSVLADVKRSLASGDMSGARARFEAFRRGLERHIDAEEMILFPEIETLSGAAHGGPTDVMREEHAELKKLMAEVTSVLEAASGEGLARPLAALTARIYAHNGKEERVLYPMADRLVQDAGTFEDVADRIGRMLQLPAVVAPHDDPRDQE